LALIGIFYEKYQNQGEAMELTLENKAQILAVDDEVFNLDLIELAFAENPNVEVIRAENGKAALEILKENKQIDVILLDLAMPVLDGFETLKILKADEELKYIPVIVVTANAEEKKRALSLRANDFISKPFDVEELKLRTLNYVEIKKYGDFLKNVNEILEQKVQDWYCPR
jgi:putative two-component system response regulator